MVSTVSVSTKIIRIGAGVLVVALASLGLTLWVTWQLEGGAAAVNEAGRMRMQAWRLTSLAQAERSPAEVAALVQQFDQSLDLLRQGDASRPLFVHWDEAVAHEFATVEALWQTQRPLWLQDTPPEPVQALATADAFVEAIDALVLAIERQLSGLTAILNLLQFLMMALAIGGSVVMIYTGYMFVIHPLVRLLQGLRLLESGDFKARVEVETLDEIGQVAAGFNRMASTLQSMYAGLETQVETKTRHIEAQRARLATLYEFSAFMAQAGSIEELSRGFAQRLRAVVKAHAVAVRWSDDAGQTYLLLASDGFPLDMAEDERSVLAGAYACGNLQPDARTRVVPIRSHDDNDVRPCVRAGFETLVSVPLSLQQRLIGEVNLFYRSQTSPSAGETDLLDALASHLANALESLRAAALGREAAVSEERAMIARELHDSIAQSLAFLKIQVQLLRKAMSQGQDARVMSTLDEIDKGLRESINDVRELLVHFRTRTNTDDIEHALQETLQKFQQQTGLPAKLQIEGHGLPLPADVQVQVLHVLQEALSNARKHARASHIQLHVLKGARWRFRVRDDGAGFEVLDAPDESHVGLKIMRERAALIGARIDVSSEPGQGTIVTLTLPPHPVAACSISAPATERAAP